jgi:hypothetical protein
MHMRLFTVFAVLGLTTACNAQDARQLADQPVFIARFNGWTQQGVEDYLRELNNDLEVGSRMVEAIDNSKDKATVSTIEAPASGILVYMVRGLIPSVEQIQFTQVADQAEFEKIVRAQNAQQGMTSLVEGSGDKLKGVQTLVSRTEITESPKTSDVASAKRATPVRPVSASSEAPVSSEPGSSESNSSDDSNAKNVGAQQSSLTIGPFGVISTTSTNNGRIVEEDGRRYLESSNTIETWYRYRDGFMLSGQSNAVWEMTLPGTELLRDQNDSELNGQITFYPDLIPMGFRQLGWDTLNAALGTQLQQHDNESDTDYTWRRAYGRGGLAMVKAVVFDTEEVSGWLKFARDDEPIRGELRIAARANSGFSKSLSDATAAQSRFAQMLDDNAAATVHVAVNLPADWKQAAEALRTSYEAEVGDAADADDQTWLDVLKSATSCSEHGMLEGMIKLGWSAESGGVVYGGLHVDENANLLNSVLTMLRSDGDPGSSIELIDKGDFEMIRITRPVDANAGFIQCSHAYVAHAESCLWFAMGGENAHEIIRSSIERCRQTGMQLRTPLLTARVDFERLMAYPQDDPTGLTAITGYCCGLMQSLVEEYGFFNSNQESRATNEGLSLRALQLSGSKKIGIVLQSDESGLFLRGTLGTALLRSWLAPAVQLLDKGVNVPGASASEPNAVSDSVNGND